MKDPRASKRRRVSEKPAHDDDGDIAMESDGDVYSAPSSPESEADSDEDQDYRGARRQASRRQSTRARKSNVPDGLENDAVETPRSTRTSGRQRKVPQRLEDAPTPSSTRKTAATPRSARGTRSARKPRQEPVEDAEMEDDQSPKPTGTITRTRSRRNTAKPRSNGANGNTAGAVDTEISPLEGYNDGLDDLVAMQLQQDLQTNEESPEAVETAEPLPDYAEKLQALCQSGLQDEVRVLTTALLEKLSGKRQIPLKGLESEYTKVNHLIEQTVTVGEGNSMLLLGSRGCGKTAIVETIISSLAKEHGNDFHVVRLNGFLHTDDRLALREMWRQLGRETHTEDDAAKVSSYADTMATLLALLSHPEELFGAGNGDNVTAAKSVVILLDEFDLFVTHPRQTLLYNLFDIAQARKAPIAVIGLTTKVDVTEMLEKRVKSRFSHRYVYIPLPKTYETFSEICLASLDLDENEVEELAAGLGSEQAITKTAGWKMLLDGWKEYLQVSMNDVSDTEDRSINSFSPPESLQRQGLPIPPEEDLPPDQIRKGIPHKRTPPHQRAPPQLTSRRQANLPDSNTKELRLPISRLPRSSAPSVLNFHDRILQSLVSPSRSPPSSYPPFCPLRPKQRRCSGPEHFSTSPLLPRRVRRVRTPANFCKDFRVHLRCGSHSWPCLGSRRGAGVLGEAGDLGPCYACW